MPGTAWPTTASVVERVDREDLRHPQRGEAVVGRLLGHLDGMGDRRAPAVERSPRRFRFSCLLLWLRSDVRGLFYPVRPTPAPWACPDPRRTTVTGARAEALRTHPGVRHEGAADRQRLPRPRAERSTATASASSTSPTSRPRRGADLTYAEMAQRARAQAAGARRARHRRRRAGRHRVPQLGPAADRASSASAARGACSCRSTSASSPRRSATSSSTPAPSMLLVDPELDEALARRRVPAQARHRRPRPTTSCYAYDRRAAAVGAPTRTPPPPSTTRAAPPPGPRACSSPTATSGSTPPTFGWQTGVSDRDVYLHTLPMFHCNGWGMPFAATGMGVQAHRDPQDRRRRDPAAHRAARRHRCCARRRRWWPRCSTPRATWDGPIPGRDRVRIVVRRRAAADPDHRAGRDGAGLGVHPDLRAHRDGAAAHDEPLPRRVGRPRRRPSAAASSMRAGAPAIGATRRRRRRRRGARPRQRHHGRATGSSPRPPTPPSSTAGSTPATAATSTRATSRSPTARRTSSSPAARTCRRSRSRTRCSRTRRSPRWRSSACPTRSGARR